jgi:4-alpha-glucanotransferase
LPSSAAANERTLVRAGLERLGIDRLVLTIHDASFPAGADEDLGRGSPYSRIARRFCDFVAARGFDGLQLGPQGKVTIFNPSPYDGAAFARSHLSVAPGPLVDGPGLAGLLPPELLARAIAFTPEAAAGRAHHRHAWHALLGALRVAHRRYGAEPEAFPALRERSAAFLERNIEWLEADALFEILTTLNADDHVGDWGADADLYRAPETPDKAQRRRELLHAHNDVASFNTFCQLVLDVQHRTFRAHLHELGMRLYADLQVGISARDHWRHGDLFLPGYAIGAPPSRTNPLGQPWGYPVLDPAQLVTDDGAPGAGRVFFERRLERLLDDFDGIRIDHPHGIVCPWVYRTDPNRGLVAVSAGARLYESPNIEEHPALAGYAIARPEDLASPAEQRPRYADDWTRQLSPAQIDRYAVLMDRVMALARECGLGRSDVIAEALSTCPYPLSRVLQRHGLGRMRVVQKADPTDQTDVYRTAGAAAQDWVTLGTHDTRPIWAVVDHWASTGKAAAWADYLATRLTGSEAQRSRMAKRLAEDRRDLVHALAADLFLGPAQHVILFVSDLLGVRETYNVPGTVDAKNWTLRVPPDFASRYEAMRVEGDALDLRRAIALALDAGARGAAGDQADLARALAPA